MSLLELTQELQRQETAPVPRFERPRDLLQFITEEKPARDHKVTIDMCVLGVEELEQCWHIEMMEKGLQDDFEKRKMIVNKLNDDVGARFIFCLSLWKSRKRSLEHVSGNDYVPGRSYVFNGVNGLQLCLGVAQGSIQARLVVKNEIEERLSKGKRKMKEVQRP